MDFDVEFELDNCNFYFLRKNILEMATILTLVLRIIYTGCPKKMLHYHLGSNFCLSPIGVVLNYMKRAF